MSTTFNYLNARKNSHINNKVLLAFAVVFFLFPFVSQAEIIFQDNFESSVAGKPPTNNPTNKISNWGACSGNCTVVTTEKARSGKKSLKTYLNRKQSNTIFRTEAVPRGEARRSPQKGIDYWYGFSLFVPNNHIPDYRAGDTFAQWHGQNGNPPVTLRIDGVNFVLTVRGRNVDTKVFQLGPYKKNAWTDWVVHTKWSLNNDGIIEVWRNGDKVVSHRGPNAVNESGAPWMKLGLYKSAWRNPELAGQRFDANIIDRTYYHDEIKIAKGANAKFEDVDPSRSSSSPSASNDKVQPPKNIKITFD